MKCVQIVGVLILSVAGCKSGVTQNSETKAGIFFETGQSKGTAVYMADFKSENIDPFLIYFGNEKVEAFTNAHCIYVSASTADMANLVLLKNARPITSKYIDRNQLATRAENAGLTPLYDMLIGLEISGEIAEETIDDPLLFGSVEPNTGKKYKIEDLNNLLDLAKKSEAIGPEKCPQSHPDLKKL